MSGKGTVGGVEFQTRLAALIAGLALARRPLTRLVPELKGTPVKIWMEAASSVDDIVVATDVGRFFIQAKRSIALSPGSDSPLAEVAQQFVRQLRQNLESDESGVRGLDLERDLLVLAVENAPKTVEDDLAQALLGFASGAATGSPHSQGRALAIWRTHIEAAWSANRDHLPPGVSPDALIKVCRVAPISKAHTSLVLEALDQVVAADGQAEALMDALVQWALVGGAAGRGGDVAGLRRELRHRGLLRVDGDAASLEGATPEEICGLLSAAASEELAATGTYHRERSIPRVALQGQLDAFVASRARVFAIVGESGVGKSSAMAMLAEGAAALRPFSCLVAGAGIAPDQDGLRSLVDRGIQSLSGGKAACTAQALAQAGASAGGLVVLLDGLNEATAPLAEVRDRWLGHTMRWIASENVKLIVTCRPEYWDLVETKFLTAGLFEPVATLSDTRDERQEGTSSRTAKTVTLDVHARHLRLTDFSTAEAERALSAAGLKGRFSPQDVSHPLLLGLQGALSVSDGHSASDLSAVLQLFVTKRVGLAANAVGRMALAKLAEARLGDLAARMLSENTSLIDTAAARACFDDCVEVLDGLVELHVLALNDQGYRFRLDHVREFLQGRRLSPTHLLQEINVFGQNASSAAARRVPGSFLGYIRYALAERKARRRTLSASAASFGVIALIETCDTGGFSLVLDALFDTTDPDRSDSSTKWTWQVVLLTLRRLGGPQMDAPGVFDWIRRLAQRRDPFVVCNQRTEFADVLADAMARCTGDVARQLDVAKHALLHMNPHSWGGGQLTSHASYERLDARAGRSPQGRAWSSPVLTLLCNLADRDPEMVLDTLGQWLDDDLGLDIPTIRGFWVRPITSSAAKCLYELREFDVHRTCRIALASAAPSALELVEALAIREPGWMAASAIEAISREPAGNRAAAHEALWNACEWIWFDGPVSAVLTFLGSRADDLDPVHLVWRGRILMSILHGARSVRRLRPDDDLAEQSARRIEPVSDDIANLLANNLHTPIIPEISEDYRYLLDHDLTAGIRMLRSLIDQNHALSSIAFAGISSLLRPSGPSSRPGNMTFFSPVVSFLEEYAQRGGDALRQAGGLAWQRVNYAGLNPGEFTADQVLELNLPDLARQAILAGGDYSGSEWFHVRWPNDGPLKAVVFGFVAECRFDDERFEAVIFNLCANAASRPDRRFEEVAPLRSPQRAKAWDEALYRFLRAGGETDQIRRDAFAFWRSLDAADLTPVTREFREWTALGLSNLEATEAMQRPQRGKAALSEHLKRLQASALERSLSPTSAA